MVQSRGRPALGEGKSLKMTVLVEQDLLESLDLVMQEMRVTMPGVRIDRSTAVRYVLTKALVPYRAAPSGPGDAGSGPVEALGTLGADRTADTPHMEEDQSSSMAAPHQDQSRTTDRKGRKRPTAAKG